MSQEQNAQCAKIFNDVNRGFMRRQRGCSLITLFSESWGLPTEDLADATFGLTDRDHAILAQARRLREEGMTVMAAYERAEREHEAPAA